MSSNTVMLKSKSVLKSEPFEPQSSPVFDLIGRTRECRMILAAWLGQPGLLIVAKVFAIQQMASKMYTVSRSLKKLLTSEMCF
jgi:hypothetical protein